MKITLTVLVLALIASVAVVLTGGEASPAGPLKTAAEATQSARDEAMTLALGGR